jgi:hypothetical protein
MKLAVVCGPWGGGTSSVAGLLTNMGCLCPLPIVTTRDVKTPVTYESVAFRNVLRQLASEPDIALHANMKGMIVPALVAFKEEIQRSLDSAKQDNDQAPVVLKHPLSCLVIPELNEVFDAHFIYVLRPIGEIERTRNRRKWAPYLGGVGAQKVYSAMFNALINHPIKAMMLHYETLLAQPLSESERLADFCGLNARPDNRERGVRFILDHPNAVQVE